MYWRKSVKIDTFITEWNDMVGQKYIRHLTTKPDHETLKYLEKCAAESMVIQTGQSVPFDIKNDGTIELAKRELRNKTTQRSI